jgi:hypothetical protein
VFLTASLNAEEFYVKLGYRLVERIAPTIDVVKVPMIRMEKDIDAK